jgi:hypothetical protein
VDARDLHPDNRFPARALQHEMAHVFAGTFGDRWFGMSLAWRWHGPFRCRQLSGGLIEGVAEAASGPPIPMTTRPSTRRRGR